MDENRLTLEFDDGDQLETEILGTFDADGVEYIALAEIDSDDVYLYRYIDNGDEFELGDIPEEDFDKVSEAFNALMDEE